MNLRKFVEKEIHQAYWKENIPCAPAVLRILSKLYGLNLDEQVYRSAEGMGGAGEYGAQCGLLEGALMFAGILGAEESLSKEDIHAICCGLASEFEEKFGSLLCREIRPEGFKKGNPPHLCEQRSVEAAEYAAGYLLSIIESEGPAKTCLCTRQKAGTATAADNKAYFNRVANQWDSMRSGFFSERIREKVIKITGIQPGDTAADIGAGTGCMTEYLIENGITVICVDHSEEMINILIERYTSKADIHQGESENLPVLDNSVNYVFANMYLHHVENPQKAINEMVRILKPGGKLVISDMDLHSHEFLLTEQHDRWPGFKRENINEWFENSGLTDVIIECAEEDCCSESIENSNKATINIFIASGTL